MQTEAALVGTERRVILKAKDQSRYFADVTMAANLDTVSPVDL